MLHSFVQCLDDQSGSDRMIRSIAVTGVLILPPCWPEGRASQIGEDYPETMRLLVYASSLNVCVLLQYANLTG